MMEASKEFAGARVLVVDDNDDFAQLVQHFLIPLGVRVEAASNGREALVMAKDCKYDVILLDLVMPDLDGLQVVERLRGDGYGQPIIAITAQALSQQQDEAIQAGCDGYYAKPVSLVKLRDVLSRYCGQRADMPGGQNQLQTVPHRADAPVEGDT